MIETVMLIAFGFCAATLLALITLPFVTRRAARLAAERLRDVVPLTVDEIAAERDGVRAAAAVEQRRLEQKAGHAEAALAARDAAYGQRTAELATLQETHMGELAAKAALAADVERMQVRCTEIETARDDLQRRLTETENLVRSLEITGRALSSQRDALESLAEERRAAIAGLETRYAGLDMRREDLEADLMQVRHEHEKTRSALLDMTRDRDLSRTEAQLVATQRAILQDDLTETNRRADSHRIRLEAKTEALAQAEQRLMTEQADHKAIQGTLADLKRRFAALEARLIAHGGGDTDPETLDSMRNSVTGVADQALDVLSRPAAPDHDAGSGVTRLEPTPLPAAADKAGS